MATLRKSWIWRALTLTLLLSAGAPLGGAEERSIGDTPQQIWQDGFQIELIPYGKDEVSALFSAPGLPPSRPTLAAHQIASPTEVDSPTTANASSCIIPTDNLSLGMGTHTLCPGRYQLTSGIHVTAPATLLGNDLVELVGPASSGSTGIEILSSNVTISGITLSDWKYGIVSPDAVSGVPWRNLQLTGNTFRGNGHAASLLDTEHLLVHHNTVESGGGFSTSNSLLPTLQLQDHRFTSNTIRLTQLSWTNSWTIGVSLSGSRARGGAYSVDSFMSDNTIVYDGCRDPNVFSACFSKGFQISYAERATVTNNRIYDIFSGDGIQFSGNFSHQIFGNTIEGLEAGFSPGNGILDLTLSTDLTFQQRSQVYWNVISGGTLTPATYGLVSAGFGGTLGGIDFFSNAIGNTAGGFRGLNIHPNDGISTVYGNLFLNTIEPIISPSVAATLPVFNNFYDSFANSSQCQPDTNGCCQNPFTFGSQGNRDLTPRGAPFQCTLAG